MNPETALAVVVFSPHALRRHGLKVALDARDEVTVAAVTGDSTDVVELVRRHEAGGLIADLEEVQDDDVESLRAVTALPGGPVTIVCFARGNNYRIAAVAGFAYVLDRRDGIDLVIAALQSEQSATLMQRQDTRREVVTLTRREQQILQELARGMSAAEAAAALGISPKTVEVHKRNLYAKLGARSQAEAVAVALRRRLLDPSAPR